MTRKRRSRKIKRCSNNRVYLLMAAGILAGAALFSVVNMDTGTEKAISNKTWEDIEPVIMSRLGDDYFEVGQCTGYVYWCLDNAYGTDWGTNSLVSDLEEKLQEEKITVAEKGRTGDITTSMKPGDIVIFINGGKRSHCAILGENGRLYQAVFSGVDGSMTLRQWMELPEEQKNCDRYVIYRGVL